MDVEYNSHEQPPFFRLPKELRLAIYDYVLNSLEPILIGTYAIKDKHVADWPLQPGLIRSCSLFRHEALSIYFSTTHFVLNLQSTRGLQMVLNWIRTNSRSCSGALTQLRHVTIIAGSGLYERPEEWVLDLHLRDVVSTRVRIPMGGTIPQPFISSAAIAQAMPCLRAMSLV